MHRFWDDLIKPIFEEYNIKNIIEIGADVGKNTLNIIKYASENEGFLHCIDPVPNYDYKELESKYPSFFKQYVDLSLNVLGNFDDIDAVLIDGDHNWYTVFNELKLIDEYDNFPLIILHDVSWPYGRRDLYYDPDTIPDEYRKPYSKKGMIPKETHLKDMGLNYFLNNANFEDGEKNGVLTAIEDFIKYSKKDLNFYFLDFFNGLGILLPKKKSKLLENTEIFYNSYPKFLKKMEKKRIDDEIINLNLQNQIKYQNISNNELNSSLHDSNIKYNDLSNEYNDLNREYNDLSNEYNDLNREYKDSNIKFKNLSIKLKNTQKLNDKLKKKVSKNNKTIQKQKKQISENNKSISKYSNSFSWKITKPIRFLGKISRKILYKPYIYIFLKSKFNLKSFNRNLKEYKVLNNSKLFNKGFYKRKYLSNQPFMNPIIHFVYFGAKEGKNPNLKFNTKFYLNKYKDVKKSKINPLVHYIKYGIKEGRLQSNVPLAKKSKIATVDELISNDLHLFKPLNVLPVKGDKHRLNIYYNNFDEESFFGGKATALQLAVQFANENNFDLRIISQTIDISVFREFIDLYGLEYPSVSFYLTNSGQLLELHDKDIFLGTDQSCVDSILRTPEIKNKIFHMMQEVETFSTHNNDKQLRNYQTLTNDRIIPIVNTKLLYDYFIENGYLNVEKNGIFFEPAFPLMKANEKSFISKKKYKLFFCDNYDNHQNLFYFALKILNESFLRGSLDYKEWEVYIHGQTLKQKFKFDLDVKIHYLGVMSLEKYVNFASEVDLCYSLMCTPHPSYSILDMVASGAVAVTNRFKNKNNLSNYSKNIVMHDLNSESLIKALKDANFLVKDIEKRRKNYESSNIDKNWEENIKKVIEHMNKFVEEL